MQQKLGDYLYFYRNIYKITLVDTENKIKLGLGQKINLNINIKPQLKRLSGKCWN